MTNRPNYLPPRAEVEGFVAGAMATDAWVIEEQADRLDEVICGVVEKALADYDFRSSRDFFEWKKQEDARHAREVERARLEAKIEAIAEMEFECICMDAHDLCPVCAYERPLRAALAALEVEP